MNASLVIKAIYECEYACRIEWMYDAGFTWSLTDDQYSRLMLDDDLDGSTVVWETSESILLRAQPLPEKDWLDRGNDYDFDTAVRQLAGAIIKRYQSAARTLKQLLA